ncbi:hypothetical protein CRENPOLYSF2_860008 [Crenothrix polyspora]|uniref:Uncharacterized protein n=1 Tax=Crenothrix polyspora TaxID=360316 RepID=A0A1R4HIL5_9GAMM|nr:hypothetical protein CRENPOLYSF2_860008 [Crenothrix polyspora]
MAKNDNLLFLAAGLCGFYRNMWFLVYLKVHGQRVLNKYHFGYNFVKIILQLIFGVNK